MPTAGRTQNDRYVTFDGIDFEGNLEAVLAQMTALYRGLLDGREP